MRDATDSPDLYPAYGLVKPLLSFGFFYVVVDAVTTSLAIRLDRVYDASLGEVGTVFAALLWLAFVASLYDVYKHQTAPNAKREYPGSPDGRSDAGHQDGSGDSNPDGDSGDRALNRELSPGPSVTDRLTNRGLAVAAGGTLVVLGWSPFLSRFGPFAAYILAGVNRTTAMPVPVDLTSMVLWGILWIGGIELFGRGVDRGLVDLWRARVASDQVT